MADEVRYVAEVLGIAEWLSRGDSFLREELRNEMHIVIMKMNPDASKDYCLRWAKVRALSYLKSKIAERTINGNNNKTGAA